MVRITVPVEYEELPDNVLGCLYEEPDKLPVITLNKHLENDPVLSDKTLWDLHYLRWEHLKKEEHRYFPFEIWACSELGPEGYDQPLPVKLMSGACRDCIVRKRKHAICPIRIAFEQKPGKTELALRMGFRLIE